MLKDRAEVIYSDGVRIAQVDQAVTDFNMQRKLNPNLGQAVGHIALAFSPLDAALLNNDKMLGIALQYLQKMKIDDTQLLVIKHNDTEHPHLHIVYNRVNNYGKTISDSLLREKNVRITRALTLEHGLYFAQGKDKVKRQSLKGADLVKYELYDAIKLASKKATSMIELKELLKKQDINMIYKYRNGTTDIQGVSFTKGDYRFKGSEIDRGFSYSNLNVNISKNAQGAWEEQPLSEQLKQIIHNKNGITNPPLTYKPSVLETLLSQTPAGGQTPVDDALQYKRKRKKGQSHSLGR